MRPQSQEGRKGCPMMFGWQNDHPRGLGNRTCHRHGSVAGLTSSTRQTHQPNFKVDFRRAHWRLFLKAGWGAVYEEQGNPEAAARRKTNAVVLGHRDRRSRDLETGIPKPQPLFPRALRKKKHPHPPSGPDKLAAVASPGPQHHPASRGLSRLASCVVLLI